jgi:TetR/AcrR family transcriptional regulator, transcriptional repressor for nem operon
VLEEATGLSRSSLANSFGTKAEMLTAALAHYNDLIAEHLITGLESVTADPGEALHQFFDALAALKADDPGRYGCLVVNTIVELAERDTAVELQIQRYEHMLLAAFTSALDRTGTVESPDVEHRANVLLALAMAVNLHARNRDTAAVAATTASAHALIDTWA